MLKAEPVSVQREPSVPLQHHKRSHGEDVHRVSSGRGDVKVALEDVDGAAQGFVATPTEQGHAHVEEDGGDERRPGEAAHASLAALLTAWRENGAVRDAALQNLERPVRLGPKR